MEVSGGELQFNWIAEYEDGTSIPQYDKQGNPNKIDDLDKDKLRYFALIPKKEGLFKYIVELDPSKDLIFYRRNMGNLKDGIKKVLYFIGWKKKIGDQEIKNQICIDPDNKQLTIHTDKE